MARRWAALLLSSTLSCNALVGFGELERDVAIQVPDAGAVGVEAGSDARVEEASCDPGTDFGPPVLVPGSLHAAGTTEAAPTLTDDELELFFERRAGAEGAIFSARRDSIDEPFGESAEVTELGSTGRSFAPTLTGDGLALFWSEQTVEGQTITAGAIMATRRLARDKRFGPPEPYRTPAETSIRVLPHVTGDGAELYFSVLEAPNVSRIHRSLRDDRSTYQAPARVAELAAGSASEGGVAMSRDGLTMFFASDRAGTLGGADVFMATRPSRAEAFTNIAHVPALSSPRSDRPGWLSRDGCRLYLGSDRASDGSLYVATRPR
ncbi:MAG: PD40 domain-containing protein [Labilithrix sp.]|nr:PD40 domain-containing protein [Labilithrix sp.]MCW5812084.1 PD40 domain-containing protein [Labilithrix sp.]